MKAAHAMFWQHVEEINEDCGDLRIEGFISLEGAYSKV